jgi:hypothetical protein
MNNPAPFQRPRSLCLLPRRSSGNVAVSADSPTHTNPASAFSGVLSSSTSRSIKPVRIPPRPTSARGVTSDAVSISDSLPSRQYARGTSRETSTAGANGRSCLSHHCGPEEDSRATHRRTTDSPGRYQVTERVTFVSAERLNVYNVTSGGLL